MYHYYNFKKGWSTMKLSDIGIDFTKPNNVHLDYRDSYLGNSNSTTADTKGLINERIYDLILFSRNPITEFIMYGNLNIEGFVSDNNGTFTITIEYAKNDVKFAIHLIYVNETAWIETVYEKGKYENKIEWSRLDKFKMDFNGHIIKHDKFSVSNDYKTQKIYIDNNDPDTCIDFNEQEIFDIIKGVFNIVTSERNFDYNKYANLYVTDEDVHTIYDVIDAFRKDNLEEQCSIIIIFRI